MERIGYAKYVVNGGDWGSIIVPELAVYEEMVVARDIKLNGTSARPARLVGIHINGAISSPPLVTWNPLIILRTLLSFVFPRLMFDEFDLLKLRLMHKVPFEASYFLQQVTKPHTIGFALQNSPVALAAWLAEKYITWTDSSMSRSSVNRDSKTCPEKATSMEDKVDLSLHTLALSIPLDEMLTTISLYWFTGSITSSVMMYHNTVNFDTILSDLTKMRITTPCAIADFPVDIIWSPLAWAQHTFTNIIQYSRMPSGKNFQLFFFLGNQYNYNE